MKVYYNEIHPGKAEWLKQLMETPVSATVESTPGLSSKSRPQTLMATPDVISSLVSESGISPSTSLGGQTAGQSGRQAVPASLSVVPADVPEPRIADTYGPGLFDSSASDALSWSLASRFQAKTASRGSILYEVTWKARVTPAGHRIPAQRASARHISVNVSTGALCWMTGRPTCAARDHKSGAARPATLEANARPLSEVAVLAGWPTTQQRDYRSGMENWVTGEKSEGRSKDLNDWVMLAGWATPNVPNGGRISGNKEDIGKKLNGTKAQIGLENQARLAIFGPDPIGYLLGPKGWVIHPACGQLGPAHSRWMMGLPEAWDVAAIQAFRSLKAKKRGGSGSKGTGTPSLRSKPRSSSNA